MRSLTTDYSQNAGDPSPYLRRIAEAGFTHVMWCHHWSTDFLYSRHEVRQIQGWLKDFGLALTDLHGAAGPEKNWAAVDTPHRLAGVELVRNRLEMTARLGAGVVVMHTGLPGPAGPGGAPPRPPTSVDALRRSLDRVRPAAGRLGVRIAIENSPAGNWPIIRALLGEYGPDYLGLCYDSGHGNTTGDGLVELETLRDRLLAIHLHDNDGQSDLHHLPFTGTVNWPRLMSILARSAYAGLISLECTMANHRDIPVGDFPPAAHAASTRLATLLAEACQAQQPTPDPQGG